MNNRVIVGLGSNIEPDKNIAKAREIISRKYNILTESRFTVTKAVGENAQPDFTNGALLLETELGPERFKAELRSIEEALGRETHHDEQAPRTIDLDIIVWNEKIIDRDFYTRDYLKQSVLELLPSLRF